MATSATSTSGYIYGDLDGIRKKQADHVAPAAFGRFTKRRPVSAATVQSPEVVTNGIARREGHRPDFLDPGGIERLAVPV